MYPQFQSIRLRSGGVLYDFPYSSMGFLVPNINNFDCLPNYSNKMLPRRKNFLVNQAKFSIACLLEPEDGWFFNCLLRDQSL